MITKLKSLTQDVVPPEAIQMELDGDEDAAVYEDLYDDKPFVLTSMVNGPSYRKWKLPLPVRITTSNLGFYMCALYIKRKVCHTYHVQRYQLETGGFNNLMIWVRRSRHTIQHSYGNMFRTRDMSIFRSYLGGDPLECALSSTAVPL